MLIQQWSELKLQEEILYRKFHWPNNTIWLQLVIPYKFQTKVLESCHYHVLAGHAGQAHTLLQIQFRLFFPHIKEIVSAWVSSCHICHSRKSPQKTPRAPMKHHLSGAPFERLHFDV